MVEVHKERYEKLEVKLLADKKEWEENMIRDRKRLEQVAILPNFQWKIFLTMDFAILRLEFTSSSRAASPNRGES